MEYLIQAVLVLLLGVGAVTLVVLRATGRRRASAAKSSGETATGGAAERGVPDSERLANRPR